jgi:hypothetical protein
MSTVNRQLKVRIALAVLTCCSLAGLNGCVFGPCGPVYIWELFGSQSGGPAGPCETNGCVPAFKVADEYFHEAVVRELGRGCLVQSVIAGFVPLAALMACAVFDLARGRGGPQGFGP